MVDTSYSEKVDTDYTRRMLDFCVADWAYHDNLIEENSFTSSSSVDEIRKSIVIKIDYKIKYFDYYTRPIVHGYLRWKVLMCIVTDKTEDSKVYQQGYKLELFMPECHYYFTSIWDIISKRDFHHAEAEKYWNWQKQNKGK